MICTVPYVSVSSDRHHPLLKITFENGTTKLDRLGVVDSGADAILIPYSLGRELGLQAPDPSELKSGTGIGGNITTVHRELTMYLANNSTGKMYEFREMVNWNCPGLKDTGLLAKLEATVLDLRARGSLVPPSSPMFEKMHSQYQNALVQYQKLLQSLEPNLLLGRTFFHNFEEITFRQNDRANESSCTLTYKVREGMPVRIHDLVSIAPPAKLYQG